MDSITVKQLKFGDSSTIALDEEQFIIDCGTDNRGQKNKLARSKYAYQAIKKDLLNGKATQFLVTHFHDDHFNGLLEIPTDLRPFKHLYLPYCLIKGENIYAGALSKLLMYASRYSWGFKLSKNIVNLFLQLENLVNDISDVIFVKAGDSINIGSKTLRVLWPECQFDVKDAQVPDFRHKVYRAGNEKSRPSIILSNEGMASSSLGNIHDDIEGNFNQMIISLKEREYLNDDMIASQQAFQHKFERYIDQLHNKLETNRNFEKSDLEDAYARLLDQNKIFRVSIVKDSVLAKDKVQ